MISAAAFLQQLQSAKAPEIQPIYLFHGEEPLFQREAKDALWRFLQSHGYLERERYEVDAQYDWQALQMQTSAGNLFSNQKVIELEMPKGSPGSKGTQFIQQWCQTYSAVSMPETVVIIRSDKLESRQLKAKWVQAIESAGLVVQSKTVEARQLPQWCQQWAQQYHIQLSSEAGQLLAERVEGNLLAADQELQKLALRYGDGASIIPIDAAEISQSVVDQTHYQLFALSTAMLLGQGQHARQILHRLQQEGLEAPIILWLLAKEVRILMNLAQAAQTGSMNTAFKRQGIWSSKQGEYQQALRRHAPQDWAAYLSLALQIDLQIKGLASGDPWSGLADLVFKIAH